jgi:hypothetical protein
MLSHNFQKFRLERYCQFQSIEEIGAVLHYSEWQLSHQQSFARLVTTGRRLHTLMPKGCLHQHHREEYESSKSHSLKEALDLSLWEHHKSGEVLLCMPAFTCNSLGVGAESLLVVLLELLQCCQK